MLYIFIDKPTGMVTIHKGECKWCNNGTGVHQRGDTRSAYWHGPYQTMGEAKAACKASKMPIRRECSKCNPGN